MKNNKVLNKEIKRAHKKHNKLYNNYKNIKIKKKEYYKILK